MSLKAQSWVATLLLVGGFVALTGSWVIRDARWLMWVALACIGLGLLTLVIAFARAARQISVGSKRMEEILKEWADRAEKEGRKPK